MEWAWCVEWTLEWVWSEPMVKGLRNGRGRVKVEPNSIIS